MELASQGFTTLPPPLSIAGLNDSPLEFSANKNQPIIREISDDNDRRSEKGDNRRDRDARDSRENNRRY